MLRDSTPRFVSPWGGWSVGWLVGRSLFPFLVADTQLYKRLGPSVYQSLLVHLSVVPSGHPLVMLESTCAVTRIDEAAV